MSFEQAMRSKGTAFSRLALVFTSGFKGSAVRLRTSDAASLFFSHKGELRGDSMGYFDSWLFGKNVALWWSNLKRHNDRFFQT
jgi:hypothetical protein